MYCNPTKIYNEVVGRLLTLQNDFELTIDSAFSVKYCCVNNLSNRKREQKYIEINKSKIASNSIEVKVIIKKEEKEYLFCKRYDDFEDSISDKVYQDVKNFIDMKEVGGKK